MAKVRRSGFVSYAHADAPRVDRFLELAQTRFSTHRELEVDAWIDDRILVGKRWEDEIAAAIEASDFGLLCLTYAFLSSDYAMRVELPALLARAAVVPFALEPVDLETADLGALAGLQVFRYRPPGAAAARSFVECGGANAGRFCDALVDEIARRLH